MDEFLRALLDLEDVLWLYIRYKRWIGRQCEPLRVMSEPEVFQFANSYGRFAALEPLFHANPDRMPEESVALAYNAAIITLFILLEASAGVPAMLSGYELPGVFKQAVFDYQVMFGLARIALPPWPGVSQGSPVTYHNWGSYVSIGRDALEAAVFTAHPIDIFSICNQSLLNLVARYADTVVSDVKACMMQGARVASHRLTSQARVKSPSFRISSAPTGSSRRSCTT